VASKVEQLGVIISLVVSIIQFIVKVNLFLLHLILNMIYNHSRENTDIKYAEELESAACG